METRWISNESKAKRNYFAAVISVSCVGFHGYPCFCAFCRQLRVRGRKPRRLHVEPRLERLCLLIWSPRSGEFVQTHVRGRVRPPYLSENPRVFMQLHLRSWDVEFAAEITNEGVRTSPCAPVCAFVHTARSPLSVRTCALAACVTEYMYECSRVYVFSALLFECIVSPAPSLPSLPPLFGFVQFPCPTDNPIYTPDYSGKRGESRVAFTLSLLLPGRCFYRTPFSMCLHRLPLNRDGWIERAYLGSIPRQHTSTRSSWFCSNMADRRVFSLLSRLDRREIVSRYFLALIRYLDLS